MARAVALLGDAAAIKAGARVRVEARKRANERMVGR